MPNTLDFLHGVETQEVISATGAIQTAKSSIIGLLGTAGKGPINIPTLLAGNPREAALTFGAFAADGFTIPEAVSGIFDQVGAMIIAINVCDPSVHFTTIANEVIAFGRAFIAKTAKPFISAYTLGNTFSALFLVGATGVVMPNGATVTAVKSADGTQTFVKDTDYTVTTANGITTVAAKTGGAATYPAQTQNVLISYTATAAEGVDFNVDRDGGNISRVPGGVIANGAAATVSYTYVDPTKVQVQNVIGGEDNFGNYLGAEAFLGAETALDLVPRILIAPRFTHQKENSVTANPVTAKLLGIAQEMKSIIFEDGPNTVDEDAIQMRNDWGTDRIMVVDPWVKITGPDGNDRIVPPSIYWAGITAQTDNNIGFWASPSNKEIANIIGTARAVDFRMGSTSCRANYLNANQVSTIIRKDGYRTWGNHSTSIVPGTTFLTTRRVADMVEESIQAAHLWAVDGVITRNYIIILLENVAAYLRHLQQVGAIYGGSAWIDRALNSDDVIANGQLYVNYDFTDPKTAEHITFVANITDKYITNIFQDISLALTNASVINVTPIVGTGT